MTQHAKTKHKKLHVASGVNPHAFVRIREAEREISRLQALDLRYNLGGGRVCGPKPCRAQSFEHGALGGDCSWLQLVVCDILKVDIKDWLGWTGTLQNEGKAGKGKIYSMFLKEPDETEGHTIGCFHHPAKDHWFECGGSDNPQPGDGVTWFHPTPERIAEFTVVRHFEGF